jgi:hypothetical protein
MIKYEITSYDIVSLDTDNLIAQIQSRIKLRSNKIAKLEQYGVNRHACNLLGDEQKYDKQMYRELCLYRRIEAGYTSL